MKFFSEEIEEIGVTGVLEKYIFGREANVRGVDMLARILSGVYVVSLSAFARRLIMNIIQVSSPHRNRREL